MAEVDVTLAEDESREINPADVAKMERSSKPQRKKQGDLLRKVLVYRQEHGVGPQPRGESGEFVSYDASGDDGAG